MSSRWQVALVMFITIMVWWIVWQDWMFLNELPPRLQPQRPEQMCDWRLGAFKLAQKEDTWIRWYPQFCQWIEVHISNEQLYGVVEK